MGASNDPVSRDDNEKDGEEPGEGQSDVNLNRVAPNA